MRLRARDIGLAIAVLALLAAGFYALFGEFTIHTWRKAVRGANVPSVHLPSYGGFPAFMAPVRAETAIQAWRGLKVAPEHRCSPYERTDYSYPQSVEADIVASMGGRIYGPYTGRYFTNTDQTDIEHMVATSEAHDSGLCAASAAIRREFARDLLNLTLAAPEVNRCAKRGKCGKDAGEWLPARNGCWFAARVIKGGSAALFRTASLRLPVVRRKYGLTIDRREARSLEQVLSTCSSTDLVFHGGNAAQPHGGQASDKPLPSPGTAGNLPGTAENPPGTTDALALFDDNRNGRISCAEARRHGIAPVPSGHPAYRYMRDGDNDGVVCE